MTIFLVIFAILLVGGTAVLASGRPLPAALHGFAPGTRADGPDAAAVARTGSGTPRVQGDGLGLVEPVASLPPVLLPDVPAAADVDAVRFGLGLRGYRMDQVDEVLDRLAAALEERDALIGDLRSRLAAKDAG
ncbi:DivIVA domain-containing protein [Arthrobacter sp. TmT3-37]